MKERIEKRSGDESDAKFEQYLMYKKLFEPIQEIHVVVDSSKDIAKQLKDLIFRTHKSKISK